MEDLSRLRAPLVPSSMEGGNLTTPPEQQAMAMTAPGSPPVTPMPALDESSQVDTLAVNNLGPPADYRRVVHGGAGGAAEGTFPSLGGVKDDWRQEP